MFRKWGLWPFRRTGDRRGPVRARHLQTGSRGEALAAKFLEQKGIRIAGRNVRVGRDEIDLIGWQGKTLVFAEVKTRASERFGRPAAAVDRAKRMRISRAAIRYIKKRKLRPDYIRFDIVEVCGEEPEIRHLANAFPLEGPFRIWW